jgi:hypothetical protein
MLNRLKAEILIHNFRLKIIANDKDIFGLIINQLNFPVVKQRQKVEFEIVFNFKKLDYREIPQIELDIFKQYPLFQNEYIANNNIILNAGLRTIRFSIDPQNNLVDAYIASGQNIDKDLLFDIIFFQPLRFLLSFHKMYLLHSSCVARDTEAVLFVGKSESGKSVLCLSLIRGGFGYISDDDTILKQNGRVVECLSFPFNLKIKNKLIRYFPEIKKRYLKYSYKVQKNRIDIQKVYPGSLQDKAMPRLIIFPKFTKDSKTKIRPLNKQVALQYLIGDELRIFKGQYEYISQRHFKIVSNLIKQVRTYQIFYRDQDVNKIPKIINELL